MLHEAKNSKKQGDIGLSLAIAWFAKRGHTVCIPLSDSQAYDLVVELNGVLKRVQVKTTRSFNQSKGIFEVELRTKGGNRSGIGKSKSLDLTKIDFLFVVTETGGLYLIPSSAVGASNHLSLGGKYAAYQTEL
jgi:hypothetical protein